MMTDTSGISDRKTQTVMTCGKPDPRLVTRLATDSWFDVVSYLPVRDVVPAGIVSTKCSDDTQPMFINDQSIRNFQTDDRLDVTEVFRIERELFFQFIEQSLVFVLVQGRGVRQVGTAL
jgi:hypothetical protein